MHEIAIFVNLIKCLHSLPDFCIALGNVDLDLSVHDYDLILAFHFSVGLCHQLLALTLSYFDWLEQGMVFYFLFDPFHESLLFVDGCSVEYYLDHLEGAGHEFLVASKIFLKLLKLILKKFNIFDVWSGEEGVWLLLVEEWRTAKVITIDVAFAHHGHHD